MFSARLAKLLNAIKENGFDGAILNPGASMTYLTGLSFHLMERPVVLFVIPDEKPILILPELEKAKLDACPVEFSAHFFGDNPAERGSIFKNALRGLNLNGKRFAVESTRLRFLEMEYVKATAPQLNLMDGSPVFDTLRLNKDPREVEFMRKAAIIAQQAFNRLLPEIQVGKTEHELANRLTALLLECGSDPELPFQVIFSSGPNSANPHAVPSERKLEQGDLVVVDWGASFQGYASDLTRTLILGSPTNEQKAIAGS
ncbi:MAG: aminopeptidase P family protein, partial [Leptolinea sp.]|nr:aminopeptidase P family protein [Leptolinea sp.]